MHLCGAIFFPALSGTVMPLSLAIVNIKPANLNREKHFNLKRYESFSQSGIHPSISTLNSGHSIQHVVWEGVEALQLSFFRQHICFFGTAVQEMALN